MYQKYTVKRLVPEGAQPEKRMRLVFFSDLHIGEAMTPDYIARAVKLIQDQQPDLILCGGDFIDHRAVYAYDPRVDGFAPLAPCASGCVLRLGESRIS